jgi:hypothetical protein
MDILCHGEWGNGEQEEDESDRHAAQGNTGQVKYGSARSH